MSDLDIQIVDSLTVNLNQEEYSTEGQVLNTIDVYVEDEQLLFEAALTQDSINLYTRETPDIISFDTKGITDGISKLESLIEKTSKESTLTSGVNELKTAIENIDLSSVESKVEEVGNKIDNIKLPEIDTTELAKETTLNAVSSKLDNLNVEVDLSSVAKQGSNADATNSAIYEAINNLYTSFDEMYAGQIKDLIGE